MSVQICQKITKNDRHFGILPLFLGDFFLYETIKIEVTPLF